MGWKGVLGFEYGIIQGPLEPDISGPELVAAVANAGGIGTLRAPDWESPDCLRGLIRKTRSLTDKPFGVGVALAFPHKENRKAISDEKVAILLVSWGEYPNELVGGSWWFTNARNGDVGLLRNLEIAAAVSGDVAKAAVVNGSSGPLEKENRPLLRQRWANQKNKESFSLQNLNPGQTCKVGSLEDAEKAMNAGVDAIIIQAKNAGGHVLGQDGLITLLPRVVDLVAGRDIPIIAAGGVIDARGYVAALALGAQGICLGTRKNGELYNECSSHLPGS
ncbi:hypothetical protein MRB53_033525 [Persea americana]|uniref:Uncharacterized protein n=1 Tax=Persea americana TaxID=3435 RepID=A0ACC2KVL8_PERAE|nr:hypothetical protein MRB53_033525 [Persea americana]